VYALVITFFAAHYGVLGVRGGRDGHRSIATWARPDTARPVLYCDS
jgi:hypothetical protein